MDSSFHKNRNYFVCPVCEGKGIGRYIVSEISTGNSIREYGSENMPCRSCKPEEHRFKMQQALYDANNGHSTSTTFTCSRFEKRCNR